MANMYILIYISSIHTESLDEHNLGLSKQSMQQSCLPAKKANKKRKVKINSIQMN